MKSINSIKLKNYDLKKCQKFDQKFDQKSIKIDPFLGVPEGCRETRFLAKNGPKMAPKWAQKSAFF